MSLASSAVGADRDAGLIQGLLLAVASTGIVVATCVVLPVLPAIIAAFPQQPNVAELVPLVVVLPTLAIALVAVVAGMLGEKLGRRRVLIAATAVFAVAGVAPIWLNSFPLILASRVLLGAAIGVMITCGVALTGDYYSGRKLQQWLAIQGGAGAIAGVAVSVVSGALGEIGWRYAFAPMFMGAALLAGFLLLPAPRVGPAQTADDPQDGGAAGEDGPAPWALWCWVFGLAIVGLMIIMPPAYELGVLVQEKALGASWMAGVAVAVLAAGAAAAAFSLGWLRGLSAQMKIAIAVAAAGVGTLLIAQAATLVPLLAGAALVGVSQGMLGPVLSIWLLENTPDRLRGRVVGVYQTLSFLALFAAPLLARRLAVVEQSSAAGMRIYAVADLVVVAALAFTFVRRPKPVQTAKA